MVVPVTELPHTPENLERAALRNSPITALLFAAPAVCGAVARGHLLPWPLHTRIAVLMLLALFLMEAIPFAFSRISLQLESASMRGPLIRLLGVAPLFLYGYASGDPVSAALWVIGITLTVLMVALGYLRWYRNSKFKK